MYVHMSVAILHICLCIRASGQAHTHSAYNHAESTPTSVNSIHPTPRKYTAHLETNSAPSVWVCVYVPWYPSRYNGPGVGATFTLCVCLRNTRYAWRPCRTHFPPRTALHMRTGTPLSMATWTVARYAYSCPLIHLRPCTRTHPRITCAQHDGPTG